jgi:hypothetical protein
LLSVTCGAVEVTPDGSSALFLVLRAHGSYAGRPRSPTTGRGRPRVSEECRPVRQRNAHDGGVTAAAVLAFLCLSMVRCSWSTTGCDRALHRPWAGHRRDGPSSTKGMAQAMTPEARDPSGVIAPVSRRRGQGASCPRSLVRARLLHVSSFHCSRSSGPELDGSDSKGVEQTQEPGHAPLQTGHAPLQTGPPHRVGATGRTTGHPNRVGVAGCVVRAGQPTLWKVAPLIST